MKYIYLKNLNSYVDSHLNSQVIGYIDRFNRYPLMEPKTDFERTDANNRLVGALYSEFGYTSLYDDIKDAATQDRFREFTSYLWLTLVD